MAYLTVKGAQASSSQLANIVLLCQIGKQMGATGDALAGALATMMQESGCENLAHPVDHDSVGLYQQRPSMGWGSYAQCSTPAYAIRKFLTPYLAYIRQGLDPIAASNAVQRSAFPTAPAQWMSEARRDIQLVTGSKDFSDATYSSGGQLTSTTRTMPYEFSRGSPDQRESSWDAIQRLASEVAWTAFMRAGTLWFVSEPWLAAQPPRYRFGLGSRGVIDITFGADSRRASAEATVIANAKRWSALPGDVVELVNQGPADGVWLVSDVRRAMSSETATITLKRPGKALLEPAPSTTTSTITVGGVNAPNLNPSAIGAGATAGPPAAQRLYNAAKAISDRGYPYVYGGGHGACGTPSGGGFDCSSSCCAALAAAGLGYTLGGPVDVSGTMANTFGQPGPGRYFTVWASPEHVWMQFTGIGPAWRFDTSPNGCGPSGPALRYCARSTSSFTPRHWPGL